MIAIEALFPVMVVPNLEAVKHFYETVFGFTAVFYDPGFYLHLVSPSSGVQIGFLLPFHASQPGFLHPVMAPEGFVLSMEVKDAALAYAEAQRLALDVAMPLKTEPWGQIHFIVRDPAGMSVDVVQHLESATP